MTESDTSIDPDGTDAEEAPSVGAGESQVVTNFESTGSVVPDADVKVTIGPQFLELFSNQLYTSPNKTFEELISNSWDAGATDVRIGLPDDLSDSDSAIWVLDNGESMDVEGFKRLWSVATSEKSARVDAPRPQIGKFGIGKLATYLLAHQLTYVCRASDGAIRVVSMDYRWIGGDKPNALHIDPVPLPVREVTEQDVRDVISKIHGGSDIWGEIQALGAPPDWSSSDEYGGQEIRPPDPRGTWTLAIMTSLKDEGRRIKSGILKRMLRTSLPLGSTFSIHFNGTQLESSKIEIEKMESWTLGLDFPIKRFSLDRRGDEDNEELELSASDEGYPHLMIPELGVATGSLSLYKEPISQGKSNILESSNGFFVNILGRVINPDDPYFGLSNLNHAAWARFRATVRIDGLNDSVSINREGLLEGRSLDIVRGLLKAMFNHARSVYDAASKANWPDAGDILTEAWGTVPFEPLKSAIEQGISSGELPSFVTKLDDEPTDAQRASWGGVTSHSDVVRDVKFTPRGVDEPVVEYDLESREVIVNESHPFVREYGDSHELKLLLRDQAMADLLTSAYMTQLGVDHATTQQVELYRDQLLRLLARLRRRTGFQIAELLDQAASHKKDKALEVILGDALEALGFIVERLGGSDNPEGVAVAPLSPKRTSQTASYSFTYDAKSSAKKKVKTGNVGTGGLVRHREDHKADHTLVVGPGFEDGALQKECKTQLITPMTAADLGRLIIATTQRGQLDLDKLRGVFKLYDPAEVAKFVDEFLADSAAAPSLSYAEIFDALEEIGFDSPDMLTSPVIAKTIRDRNGSAFPTKQDVAKVLQGMQILTPHLIRVQGDNVFLGARPDKFRQALLAQVAQLPEKFKKTGAV